MKNTFKFFNISKEDYSIIQTAGGIHCLVKKESLNFNPNDLISKLSNSIDDTKEIKLNSNCMIPVPGTYQYNIPVRLVE